MNLPSASSLDRAERCPASTCLPVVHEAPAAATRLGTAIHAYLANVGTIGQAAAIQQVPPEHRTAAEAINLEGFPHVDREAFAFEVSYAWDWAAAAARELGRNLDRQYGAAKPSEMVGTADIVAVGPESVVVLDLKTGWRDLGEPAKSLQLGFLAVAAAHAYGRAEATVGWLRIIDGEAVYRTQTLDFTQLVAMAERIAAVVDACFAAELLGADAADYRLGEHCHYCPAFLRCPAQMGLARQLAHDTELAGSELPPLTPEDAPRILERLEASEKLLERIRKHVDAYAKAMPIRFPDGRAYCLQEKSREKLDPDKAGPVLKDFDLVEAIEVTRELTKASLKRAIAAAHSPRGTETKVLVALKEAGAISDKPYTSMGYEKAPKLPAGAEVTP